MEGSFPERGNGICERPESQRAFVLLRNNLYVLNRVKADKPRLSSDTLSSGEHSLALLFPYSTWCILPLCTLAQHPLFAPSKYHLPPAPSLRLILSLKKHFLSIYYASGPVDILVNKVPGLHEACVLGSEK